ncbi:uncharacterized protein [Amphiura filiformis]|uniref:uncharacterized protein n=1 Tax=Amphiura filiformis TaxID=82378 RepID=UPI003B20C9C4
MYKIHQDLVEIEWMKYLTQSTSKTRGHKSHFRAIDQATQDQKDKFRGIYSVLEVNVVFEEEKGIDLTLIQWIFLAFALTFMFLFVILVIAFVFTRNDYRRKLRAATAGMMGTSKPIQQTVVPGTNKFATA